MADAFLDGIQLFNSRKFFECHEALEALWLKASGDEKVFLQGIIQVAAAFHHFSRGNHAGAQSLLREGRNKLERFGNERRGLDLAHLLEQLDLWQAFLQRHERAGGPGVKHPALPNIQCLG